MPVICLGPVCIPLHLLLPFLIGLAHQYGYLKWFKREWVTLRFWTNKFRGKTPAANATAGGSGTGTSADKQASPNAYNSTATANGPKSETGLQGGPKAASQADGEGRPNSSGPPSAQTQQQAQGQVNKKDD